MVPASSSGADPQTVHLTPIIKTNAHRARELDLAMIQSMAEPFIAPIAHTEQADDGPPLTVTESDGRMYASLASPDAASSESSSQRTPPLPGITTNASTLDTAKVAPSSSAPPTVKINIRETPPAPRIRSLQKTSSAESIGATAPSARADVKSDSTAPLLPPSPVAAAPSVMCCLSPSCARSSDRDAIAVPCITLMPFRLSFTFTLIALCIIQVVVSCGTIWALGYFNSLSLINTLSTQLRESALAEIGYELTTNLVRPMRVVMQLEYVTSRSFPDFATATTMSDRYGVLADVSEMILVWPTISGLGCASTLGLFFSAINITAYKTANTSHIDQTHNQTGYAYGYLPIAGETQAIYTFSPSGGVRYDPVTHVSIPDFNANSTEADLGEYWYSQNGFITTNRSFFTAATAGAGTFVWSPITPLSGSSTSLAVFATKANLDVHGNVLSMCFCSMYLDQIHSVLQSLTLAYGVNGIAMIFDDAGRLIGSSDDQFNTATTLYEPAINSSDLRLRAIAGVLDDHNLISGSPQWTPTPVSDFLYTPTLAANSVFDAESITLDGASYHLEATLLDQIGLNWIVVVITYDDDFNGGLAAHNLATLGYSLLVLFVAIIVMMTVSYCLSRPLSLIVRFMQQVAHIRKNQKGPSQATYSEAQWQLMQLKDIYARWKEATTVEEEESETSQFRTNDLMLKPQHNTDKTPTKDESPANLTASTTLSASSASTLALTPNTPSPSTTVADKASQPLSSSSSSLLSTSGSLTFARFIDRCAIHLMHESEYMQLTFQSMLHQLTKSYQQLENANQAKRHFVRYIFHECRVPLNAVMLGLADLQQHISRPNAIWTNEQTDVLDIVHEQSQVVGRILNDVLSLHRIEDGALQLQFAPFDLISMILSTMQSFQPGIHEKQIHYTAQLQTLQQFIQSACNEMNNNNNGEDDDVFSTAEIDVIGDKYRLRQVLANLISNAIKFTSVRGSIHVQLSISSADDVTHNKLSTLLDHTENPNTTQTQSHHHHHVVAWPKNAPTDAIFTITVRDTGVGVSPMDQAKLFSPYMQILPGELQKGAGTGLGLNISL